MKETYILACSSIYSELSFAHSTSKLALSFLTASDKLRMCEYSKKRLIAIK